MVGAFQVTTTKFPSLFFKLQRFSLAHREAPHFDEAVVGGSDQIGLVLAAQRRETGSLHALLVRRELGGQFAIDERVHLHLGSLASDHQLVSLRVQQIAMETGRRI